jgi:hypothetical protein
MNKCAYCGEKIRKGVVTIDGEKLHPGDCAHRYVTCCLCERLLKNHPTKTFYCDCGNPVPGIHDCVTHGILCDNCATEVEKQLLPQVIHEMSTMTKGESRRMIVETFPRRKK